LEEDDGRRQKPLFRVFPVGLKYNIIHLHNKNAAKSELKNEATTQREREKSNVATPKRFFCQTGLAAIPNIEILPSHHV
jgi:hypothetical protein